MDTLKEIKEYAEKITGEWDGDLPGLEEDRANIAGDILDAIQNIEDLLNELK